MKRSLLQISVFLLITGTATAQNVSITPIKATPSGTVTATTSKTKSIAHTSTVKSSRKKKRKVKRVIVHGSQNQGRLDSLKQEQNNKKKR